MKYFKTRKLLEHETQNLPFVIFNKLFSIKIFVLCIFLTFLLLKTYLLSSPLTCMYIKQFFNNSNLEIII